MRDIFKGYRIFRLDPKKLRSPNFFRDMIAEREIFWPKRSALIKPEKDAVCFLCQSKSSQPFLNYLDYALHECGTCSAVFANIKIAGEDNVDLYDSKLYEENMAREIISTYDYRKAKFGMDRYHYLKELIPIDWEKARVLDFGCGPGYVVEALKDNGVHASGLELTPYLVNLGRDRGLEIHQKKISEMPKSEFDVITMFDVLEHLTTPIEIMHDVNRSLKRKGYLLAFVPNIHSLAYLMQGGRQNTLAPFEHVIFYDKKSLDFLAAKSGFRVAKIEHYGLDVVDYLSMKEAEDGIEYNAKLADIIPYLQATLDRCGVSNHMRVLFEKIEDVPNPSNRGM